MFGHGAKSGWSTLGEKVQALESGSRDAFAVLQRIGENMPEGQGLALAGLLADQIDKALRLAADRTRRPEIAEEKISQPIIIIGMPRSGTSLLHALMATDPANRAPRVWELMTPSPPAPDATERLRRIARSAEAVQAFVAATPDMLKVHPYWDEADGATIECEDIMQLSLISPYFPAFFDLPGYDRWLVTADHGPAYRVHYRFLQQMQWRSPRRRWVLKGVMHVDHLDLLLDTYPDACLVWPHRDPAEQLASMCAIVAVTRRVDDPAALHGIYRQLLDNTARGLDAALAHPASRDGRILHYSFADLNRAPRTIVQDVYDRMGLTVSDAHAAAMTAWLASPDNAPARHGRISNDLGRFGGSLEDVRARCAAYIGSGLLTGST